MAGVKALRKLQLGKETTAGTAVAASAIWRGLGTLEDKSEYVMVPEDVGLLSGTDRQYCAKNLGALGMDDTEATFEQLPYILEAGVKLVNTGVTDTGGSGKVYTYPFATNAQPTVRTFTVEGGDDQQAEEMEYAFVDSFKLSGKGGEALKVSANWMGRQISTCNFTGAINLPSVEEAIFSKGVLYIDATTIGTTTKSQTLLGFDLDVKTGIQYVFTADGQKYFSLHKAGKSDIVASLTFEHDATSVAEKAAWRAGTRRLIRLNINGSALTTAGTFTYKTLRIDMGGKWLSFDKIGEQDGNDIVTGKFKVAPDTAGAGYCTITVVNENATIT